MAKVRVPAIMREKTDGSGEVNLGGATVGEVLAEFGTRFPQTREQIFTAGELNRFINVYIGDEEVRSLDGLATAVTAEDVVVILPAMAGGSLTVATRACSL